MLFFSELMCVFFLLSYKLKYTLELSVFDWFHNMPFPEYLLFMKKGRISGTFCQTVITNE